MSAPWTDWDHVLKLDPDKDLVEGDTYEDVMATGTDAIEIGGTLDVTTEKMERVIDACRKYDVPLYQEPSDPTVVIDDDALDGYLVPTVLNTTDPFFLVGAHKEWARIAEVPWAKTTLEAYVVLNPEASVAQFAQADTDQRAEDVAAYAQVA
ncbi:MAG: heptaprenylglyceryl phosphate synthase, partial [Halobacteriales archaeon]